MSSVVSDDLFAPVPEWMIVAFPETLAVTGFGWPEPDCPDRPRKTRKPRPVDLSYRAMP